MEAMYTKVEGLFPDADERGKVWAALLSKPESDRRFYLLGVDEAVRSALRSLLPSPGSSGNIETYFSSVDHNYKVISKGLMLALRPTFRQLRRAPSVPRSDEPVRDADLKKNLVQIFYGIDSPVYVLECPITKLKLPSTEVRAAHIYPVRAMENLEDFCPDIPHINHISNCMLWAEPIEQAFESSGICFSWNAEGHTITPTVLDRNLLDRNMLEAYRYMKGNSEQVMVAEKEMSIIEMEALSEVMKNIAASKGSNRQKENKRNKCQASWQPYANLQYTKISFNDINGKAIKLPENVELSQGAFELTAALALDEAKKKGVLPEGLEHNLRVQYGGDSGLLDLFLASQDVCFEYISDSASSIESIKSFVCDPSEYDPVSVGPDPVAAAVPVAIDRGRKCH